MFMFRSHFFIRSVLLVLLSFLPHSVRAAELSFRVIPNTEVDDATMLVEVRIDPQSKTLNVVEGEIQFSGTASDNLSVQVENGQSILPLWPTPPQYDTKKKSMSFTGGVPSGFDSEGLLFRMRLSSTVSGSLTLSYVSGTAYLNDGKGTTEFVSSKPFDITFGQDVQAILPEATSSASPYTYGMIIVSVIAVLMIIIKFGRRKNVKQ